MARRIDGLAECPDPDEPSRASGPEDIARMAVFLDSSLAGYVNGANIRADRERADRLMWASRAGIFCGFGQRRCRPCSV